MIPTPGFSLEPHEPAALETVLGNRTVVACYQPIVSIKTRRVIGLEALCRGVGDNPKEWTSPSRLFSQAVGVQDRLDLDRLFREKSLEFFPRNLPEDQGDLVFLNLEASVLESQVVGSGKLLEQVQRAGFQPERVVIELRRTAECDLEPLLKFVRAYREKGFLIALGDMGSAGFPLERVLVVEPDLVKIDREITASLDRMPARREVFRSLVNLARRTGSLVVVEGVEREEEALAALELGADLLQGHYFARPQPAGSPPPAGLKPRLFYVASRHKRRQVEAIRRSKADRATSQEKIAEIVGWLAMQTADRYEEALRSALDRVPETECLYILDRFGVQTSSTVGRARAGRRAKAIFQPAPAGTDHSLKEYYYGLAEGGAEAYRTEPYISLATGRVCVTASIWFTERGTSKRFILCVDFPTASRD